MFETPTAAGLAARLDGELSLPAARSALRVLLPLRAEGGRPPFFCIHPSTGLIWCYAPLAGLMGPGRPLYGLQARGLGDDAALPASVAAMAADYIEQLAAVQPAGPYHLLGWSLGGVVAHEIAVQLQDAGEEVAALVMLDAYPATEQPATGHPATERETAGPGEAEAVIDGLLSAEEAATVDRVRRNSLSIYADHRPGRFRGVEALIGSDHEVPLVITHPASDHPYETIWNDSVAALAAAHGIPVIERAYANDSEVLSRVGGLAPDILVSSDWRTWVAPESYELARYGAINVHDALLPRYGGFAPLNWALVNGEREVGVTAHFMNEEFDMGDIVVQRRVPVDDDDTATDLFHKSIVLFAPITLEALALIGSGRTDWIKQDPAQATFFHKRSAEDSRIDWKLPATRIANLVRAQADPYPNAFAYFGGERVRVLEASVSPSCLGGTRGRTSSARWAATSPAIPRSAEYWSADRRPRAGCRQRGGSGPQSPWDRAGARSPAR